MRRSTPWFLWAIASLLRGETAITGRVTNDTNAPVAGARIVVSCSDGPIAETVSDQSGAFQLRRAGGEGGCQLSAERTGYFRVAKAPIAPAEGGELHVVLAPLREVYERVNVSASTDAVGLESASQRRSVSGAEMLAVPFPASDNLKNALRIMPGVVQDAKAGIHVNGAAEEQVLYTLDGFTLNDPLTGRLESRVGVEAVQSLEVADGRLPAEFGRGAAGVVEVSPRQGDDRLRYTATNFFPGVETTKGIFIGNWSPRFGVSGPIRRGRAWFSDSASIQYTQEVLPDLPTGADRLNAWRFDNLLHTQVNLRPNQLLYVGILFNGWWAPRNGLNALTPLETTVDRRSRQWFAYLKHQAYLRGGALVELGYAASRSYAREAPHGTGPMIVSPDGYAGNASLDATRYGSQNQWLASVVLPQFSALGSHQLKIGSDVTRVSFDQEARRAPIEYYVNGRIASRAVFEGPGALSRSDLAWSGYLQDAWRWRRDVLVEAGARLDGDRLVGSRSVSPRLGLAWMPRRFRNLIVRGGFALVYEDVNLRLFTRPLDEYALTTYYTPSGSVGRADVATLFTIGNAPLSAPRARNWSAGVQHSLTTNTDVQVRYYGRRGDRGFTYVNQLMPGGSAPPELARQLAASSLEAVYALGNDRRDSYDSLEVSARQTIRGQYGWTASYTRSRSISNAVLDIEITDPTRVLRNAGPMPWDAPHRLVGWAYLPLWWKGWAVAGMVDARTGFPYSVQGPGFAVADVNTRRFPFFFEWNQHVERRFAFRSHRWEFRVGLNNLTNHYNPNVVNANAESRNFLRYYGGQRRAVNFRIRWLGRAEAPSKRR